MLRRRRGHSTGFIITLELILIFTILAIGSLVGVIAVRNALFQFYTAKAQFDVVIGDSNDPQVLVKPVNYDLCEAPQILCKDPELGLFALVGIRPERFVSRDRVYFTAAGCTGTPYVATPGDASLPVGYLNALQGVSYAVGPPADFPACTLGVNCTSVGNLYRNISLTPPDDNTVSIASVWTSLNPDCYLFSNTTDPVTYSDPPGICENFGPIDAFDYFLLEAEEVVEDGSSDNVLDKFAPLLGVVLPTVTEVTVTPPTGEGVPPDPGPGDPITETGQPTMQPPGPEDDPPL
jgi:hypothetical protein